MQNYLDKFEEHLKYERNLSIHTLRNYMSDLRQFQDYLCPVMPDGSRRPVEIQQIDHITIREYLATFYKDQHKKTSIARKLATLRTFFKFLCRARGWTDSSGQRLRGPGRITRIRGCRRRRGVRGWRGRVCRGPSPGPATR